MDVYFTEKKDSVTVGNAEREMPAEAGCLGKVMDTERISERRKCLANVHRIVIKIGSSSLTHHETGMLDLVKLEILVREITDLVNRGLDVILVSSGAIMVGRNALGMRKEDLTIAKKQACASVGQARLMMIYQKLFSEYNKTCSQVLLTKNTMLDNLNRYNARNCFQELLEQGVVPIVNENDTIATYEIDSMSVFGDNDQLSAVVAALTDADLLILLSDIDGLYTDDPHVNSRAKFIETVDHLDESLMHMGKSTTGSNAGTGGMATKLSAARIAGLAGCSMIIASGDDFHNIHRVVNGEPIGTLFLPGKKDEFYLIDYLESEN
jgi:glutamate 5-kinase